MKKKGISYAHILILITLFTILIVMTMPVFQPIKDANGHYIDTRSGRFVDEFDQAGDRNIDYSSNMNKVKQTIILKGQTRDTMGISGTGSANIFNKVYSPAIECKDDSDSTCRAGDVIISFELRDKDDNKVEYTVFDKTKIFKDGNEIVFEERRQ